MYFHDVFLSLNISPFAEQLFECIAILIAKKKKKLVAPYLKKNGSTRTGFFYRVGILICIEFGLI